MRAHTEYLTFHTKSRRELVPITPTLEQILVRSGIREGFMLVSAMHITAGVFVNDDESGLHRDIWKLLEGLAPKRDDYEHHRTGEDNGDAHLKSLLVRHEVMVPSHRRELDFGPWQQVFYAEFDEQQRQAGHREGDGDLMRHAGAIVLGVGLAACAASPSAPTVDPTASRGVAQDEAAREATVRDGEARVLELLAATDPRFAARVGGAKEARLHAAAIKALSEGDTDAAIEDGAIDFFSFTARARSIAEAEAVVAGLPAIDGGASAKMERELLVRLVAEERARLDEERALPRGASALVRGLIETWGAPATRPAAETHDARVARRLEEVRVSLQGGDLSRVRLAELDDSLDPLERIATPDLYGKTVQAIARLRLTLGDTTTHAQEDDAGWPRLRASLHAHLGVDWTADELRSRLLTAEHTLRARATAQTAHAHTDEHERDLADGWTVRAAPCAQFGGASQLRALPPPPERAPISLAIHPPTEANGKASVVASDDTVLAAPTARPPRGPLHPQPRLRNGAPLLRHAARPRSPHAPLRRRAPCGGHRGRSRGQ